MDSGSLSKKGFKIDLLFDLFRQFQLGIASQPADDLVNFFFRATFTLRFLIYSGYTLENAVAKIRC